LPEQERIPYSKKGSTVRDKKDKGDFAAIKVKKHKSRTKTNQAPDERDMTFAR